MLLHGSLSSCLFLSSLFVLTRLSGIHLQIRNKRLAMLANSSASTTSQAPPQSDGESESAPKPETHPSATDGSQSAGTRPAFHSAPSSVSPSPRPEQQQSEGKRIKITPASTAPSVPERPRSAFEPSSTSGAPATPSKPEETLEAFEDRTLSAVFRITLRQDRQKDIHGHKLFYLPGVRSELEEQGRELRMDISLLDQALLEAASNADGQRPLDYLLPCWKRVQRLYKGFRKAKEDDPKFNVISEARRLCMSYCIFAITMPEMFGCVTSCVGRGRVG